MGASLDDGPRLVVVDHGLLKLDERSSIRPVVDRRRSEGIAPLHDRQAETVLLEIRLPDGQCGVCDDAEAYNNSQPGHYSAKRGAALVLIVLRGRRVVRASTSTNAVEERVRVDRRDVQAAARDGGLAPDLVAEVVRPEDLAFLAVEGVNFPVVIPNI